MWQRVRQFIIQSVNTLNHKYIPFAQPHHASFIFPLSGLKIKDWKFHLSARKQFLHIIIEAFYIQCFQTLKIKFSIFITGC